MNGSISNVAIAGLLERHGSLLEVAGESPFRSRAYARAAESIGVLRENVATLAQEGRLRDVPGIGAGIAAIIEEILATGTFEAHTELSAQFPESLIEVLTIPGIGAKTAQKLHRELGVDSVASLEAALVSGQIAETKGLGKRLETTVRAGLESLQLRTGRNPLGAALPIARAFMAAQTEMRPGDTISLAGSARRWDVTVGDLDFVIATTDPSASMAGVSALPMVAAVASVSEHALRLELAGGLAADVYFTNPDAWGSTLVRATGNARHLDQLGDIPTHASTEEEVYDLHGLPWIPPELREGDREFDDWREIPELVTLANINGQFHAHTTWSDGGASIRDMALAAADRGYVFFAITDHSHGLGVAGGLDTPRLSAQREELAAIGEVEGVMLLAGSEVEVHRDGSLDFDERTLAGLDVVVASLHTGLRQPRAEITDRLIRVLRDRNVDIIAHPSGRLIERRQGGDFDWDRVFAVAAETGTALEINADPARLDLDPHLARQASAVGCLITINSDAHSPSGLDLMEYGVAMARKAWLTPTQILNCWTRPQVLKWLATRERPD
jgi:DNA polymerase (family 10)